MNRNKGIQSLIEAAQQIADLRAKSKDKTQQMADLATEARITGKSQSHRLSELPPVVDFGGAIDHLCDALKRLAVPKEDLLFGAAGEKRRADQLSLNNQFRTDKMDRIHAALCPGEKGAWQERAEQAVAAVERLVGKSQ
jgi:hypothetical protein